MMTPAQRMQNALRILHSLDEVSDVIGAEAAKAFHADPVGRAIRMDEQTWSRVFALVEKRQPEPRELTTEESYSLLRVAFTDSIGGEFLAEAGSEPFASLRDSGFVEVELDESENKWTVTATPKGFAAVAMEPRK